VRCRSVLLLTGLVAVLAPTASANAVNLGRSEAVRVLNRQITRAYNQDGTPVRRRSIDCYRRLAPNKWHCWVNFRVAPSGGSGVWSCGDAYIRELDALYRSRWDLSPDYCYYD
jgi:hypothetical protein